MSTTHTDEAVYKVRERVYGTYIIDISIPTPYLPVLNTYDMYQGNRYGEAVSKC
jgi:hypothetical protein